MSENDNNNSNENVFFSLDESEQSENSNEIPNFLDDFDFSNEINDLNNEGIIEVISFDYKINYTVKELLLMCEYYGIAKELKNNKCCKDVIIHFLVDFESNPLNNTIVLRRQEMWRCINILKNDKFMKKYVLW
jgi:hypothetical protein